MTDPTRIYDDQHNNAPAVPHGWKLVPVEPTRAMWAAVNKLDDEMAAGSYDGKGCSIEQAWNCMLDFAPDAPALAATPAPAPAQERCSTCGYLTSEREHLGCLRRAVKDLDIATGGPYDAQEVGLTDETQTQDELHSLRLTASGGAYVG